MFNSLLEIVTFFNRPAQDRQFLQRAGIELDVALFPMLVRIGVAPGIGIGELAQQVGRDHSTVSRQVAKLEAQGYVERDADRADGRVQQLRLSRHGRLLASRIARERRHAMSAVLADWQSTELAALHDSLQHLAETLRRQR